MFAKDYNIPVIALAQLSRGAEKNATPTLADLRESGNLEQDSDVVVLLHRPKDYEMKTELIVAKDRDGGTGTIDLELDVKHMIFQPYNFANRRPVEKTIEMF
jgi:replicative DNA helicase